MSNSSSASESRQAFFRAIRDRRIDDAIKLIESGAADPNWTRPYDGKTPLQLAVVEFLPELFEYLLSRREVDRRLKDRDGKTAVDHLEYLAPEKRDQLQRTLRKYGGSIPLGTRFRQFVSQVVSSFPDALERRIRQHDHRNVWMIPGVVYRTKAPLTPPPSMNVPVGSEVLYVGREFIQTDKADGYHVHHFLLNGQPFHWTIETPINLTPVAPRCTDDTARKARALIWLSVRSSPNRRARIIRQRANYPTAFVLSQIWRTAEYDHSELISFGALTVQEVALATLRALGGPATQFVEALLARGEIQNMKVARSFLATQISVRYFGTIPLTKGPVLEVS